MIKKTTNQLAGSFFLIFISFFIFICFPLNGYTELVIGKYINLYSKNLKEERKIIINLPEGYDKSNNAYPVLYLLDADWKDHFITSVGTAGYLSQFGRIPQLIVVGICNTDRNRDMFPVKVKDRPNSGGAYHFLNFISKELMPYVNKNYRTEPFSILYGGSNAGLFTVYALLEKPNFFNAYIAGSPMIGHCKDFIYARAENFLNSSNLPNRYLYLIYGKNDFSKVTSYVPDFFNYLKSKAPVRLTYNTKIIEDDGHVPYTSLFYGLRFIFSGWQLAEDSMANAGLDDLKKHYKKLSKKYGYEVMIPLNTLLSLGYRLLQQEKVPGATEVLLFCSQKHPYSPDVFYYLGLAYEKNNSMNLALKNYKKALAINPDYQMASEKIKEIKKK